MCKSWRSKWFSVGLLVGPLPFVHALVGAQETPVPSSQLSSPIESAQKSRSLPVSSEGELTFVVSKFNLVGPELLPRQNLFSLLNQFANRPITFADLRLATLALEKAHAIAGFEVVQVLIPEQDFTPEAGLTLQIVDATLNSISINGAKFFDESWIAQQLPSLKPNQPINTQEMDREVRFLSVNPSVQAKVTLEPSSEPRQVDAVVQIQDIDPSSLFFTLDNTGSNSTGDFRSGLIYLNNNIFDQGHQLIGQVVTSPGHWPDVKIYSLNYKVPQVSKHRILEVSYIDSSVNAGSLSLGNSSLSIQGSGSQLAFKNTYLLNQIEGFDTRLLLSYELKRFNSRVVLEGNTNSLVPDIESRPIGLGFALKSLTYSHQFDFLVNYHQNIATGGNNSQAAYSAIKPGANVDFGLVKGNASLSGPIDSQWRYTTAVGFQFTNDSLISGEQFGAGGLYSVRGFDERAVSADSGYRLSVEMQSPNLISKPIGCFNAINSVVFVEGAAFRVTDAPQGDTSEPYIASYGTGLRFNLSPLQQIRADFAKVISGVDEQPHGDWMFHFSYTVAL